MLLDSIDYSLDTIVKQYDAVTSLYISGDSIPAEKTVITKRIPTNVTGKNQAASFKINEIIFSNKIEWRRSTKRPKVYGRTHGSDSYTA